MSTRKLEWTPRFAKNYGRFHETAFATLGSADEKAMKRLWRIGETLGLLGNSAGPPENDRRLDTRKYRDFPTRARSARTSFGSRSRQQPADYRVVWRYKADGSGDLELLALI